MNANLYLVYRKQGGRYGERRRRYGLVVAERGRRPFAKNAGLTMQEVNWKADFHPDIKIVLDLYRPGATA